MQDMGSNPIPSMLIMLNSTISNTKLKNFFYFIDLSHAKKIKQTDNLDDKK